MAASFVDGRTWTTRLSSEQVLAESILRRELDLLHISEFRQQLRQGLAGPDCDNGQSIGVEMFLRSRQDFTFRQCNHAGTQLLEKILGKPVIFQLNQPPHN